MTFTEEQHPRVTDGRFTEKPQTAPETTLTAIISERDVRVEHSETTTWHYDSADSLHCIDGPAVHSRDYFSSEICHYYFHGTEIYPPDNTGYDLARIDTDGTQHWQSHGGNRTVTATPEGHTTFKRDGDIHRDGGPAIIVGDSELWYRNDHPIANPWPARPTVTVDAPADTRTVTGSKYVPGAEPKKVAAGVRADVAALVEAGCLGELGEKFEVSVRKDRSDRPTVSVVVSGLNRSQVVRDSVDGADPFHTDEVREIVSALDRVGESFNRVTSHNGTDSVQSPFWFSVSVPTAGAEVSW